MKNLSNEDFVKLVNTLKEEIEIKKAIEEFNKNQEKDENKIKIILEYIAVVNIILIPILLIDYGIFYIIKYLWGIF